MQNMVIVHFHFLSTEQRSSVHQNVDNSIFEQPIILYALQPTGSLATQTEE